MSRFTFVDICDLDLDQIEHAELTELLPQLFELSTVAKDLADYCKLRLHAQDYRHIGLTQQAKLCYASMDAIYQRLPRAVKWKRES